MKTTLFGMLGCLVCLYLLLVDEVYGYGYKLAEIGFILFAPCAIVALIGLLSKWHENKNIKTKDNGEKNIS